MTNNEEEVPDEPTGVCGECHSQQSDAYMNKDPFFQSGQRVSCQFCGGNVFITMRSNIEQALKQFDRDRGL